MRAFCTSSPLFLLDFWFLGSGVPKLYPLFFNINKNIFSFHQLNFFPCLSRSCPCGLLGQIRFDDPTLVSPMVALGFFFKINLKSNSGRHPNAMSLISSPYSGDL